MDKDRAKKLDTVFSQIEKQFGEGSLMKLGSDQVRKIPSISTGALSIDLALGIGGVPKGRVIEIYGPESSGKTTLSLHIAACLLYTSPSPRDVEESRMPSSA